MTSSLTDQTHVPALAGRFLSTVPPGKALDRTLYVNSSGSREYSCLFPWILRGNDCLLIFKNRMLAVGVRWIFFIMLRNSSIFYEKVGGYWCVCVCEKERKRGEGSGEKERIREGEGEKETEMEIQLNYIQLQITLALVVKNLPANSGNSRNASLIPGSGRSLGGGHGNPLQYS